MHWRRGVIQPVTPGTFLRVFSLLLCSAIFQEGGIKSAWNSWNFSNLRAHLFCGGASWWLCAMTVVFWATWMGTIRVDHNEAPEVLLPSQGRATLPVPDYLTGMMGAASASLCPVSSLQETPRGPLWLRGSWCGCQEGGASACTSKQLRSHAN